MKKIQYVDYKGISLPTHDGTAIYIDDDVGYQFFGVDGQGIIHDGTMLELNNGKKQYFMSDGRALIHDGTPIELPNGKVQYFDEHDGTPFPLLDERKLEPLLTKQRTAFFENRISHINKETPLNRNEVEDLRLIFLASEHPDYIQRTDFKYTKEAEQIKIDPLCNETIDYLFILKHLWCSVWREYQLRHKEMLATRFVLQIEGKNGCHLAASTIAESHLIFSLQEEAERVERFFNLPQFFDDTELLACDKKGMLELDAKLLSVFKRNSHKAGSRKMADDLAAAYRKPDFDLQSRIEAWKHPLYLYRCLGMAIWFDDAKDEIEALQKKPASLTYLVHENIHQPMRKGTKYKEETKQIVDAKGRELALVDSNYENDVPSMEMEVIQKILASSNVKVLSTINAHRLLRWLIQTVTKQFVKGYADARAIRVPGGFKELARMIGAGEGRKAADQIHKIIVWLAHSRFQTVNGTYGNLLSYTFIPEGPGRKSMLSLVLGDMLLPHYVYQLVGISQTLRESKRLIPIVDMPPLIGRPNDQGPQACFQMEILVEMRKRAQEFARAGGILLTNDRLNELAAKADLPINLLPRLMEKWTQDSGDKSGFLEIVAMDRYSLGKSFNRAQDFIIKAGKKELNGAKAGKALAGKKEAGAFSTKKQKKLPL